MHPALSIIIFTTVSGLGFGLFVWLGLGQVAEGARLVTGLVAFALSSAGLLSSTFHLGHPERAWRALSQWRSSWLSREGIMAIATLGIAFAWWASGYVPVAGYLLAATAFVTVYTTSMIYAQMQSVQQWNTPLTPAVFLLLALAGGGLLAAIANAIAALNSMLLLKLVAALLLLAWAAKFGWWQRANGDIELSDAASATQLGSSGEVRLFESPHSGSNYLLNEMGFRVGRKHARALRRIAFIAGGALPILLVTGAMLYGEIAAHLLFALMLHVVGLFAERWLFFAEARHAVMSFYE